MTLRSRHVPGLVLSVLGGVCVLAPFAMAPPAGAQVNIEPRRRAEAPEGQVPRPDIRTDAAMVLIPVSVNDSLGRPVAGLEAGNFRLTDDEEPQEISAFSRDDEPVALGLIFDTSGSMSGALRSARRAANMFIAGANPGDEFMLVEFNSRPNLTVPLTADLSHIRYELMFTESRGETALLDAVYLGMHEIKKSEKRRKALIVVSDGADNNSRYSQGEVQNVVEEGEVLIYSVGVFSRSPIAEPGRPGLLRALAEQTGGRMFTVERGLADIAQKITVDLRNRYVIGYVPSNRERNGKYHKVEVELKAPRGLGKLKTYWRRGYYAPVE